MKTACKCFCLALALLPASCGSDDNGEPELTDYAGYFTTTETFNTVQGNGCSEPAVKIVENGVAITIDRNEFEASFDERWPTLYGEIHEDTRFQGTKSDPDRRTEFSGAFQDLDHFSGLIKDIDGPCTTLHDVVGVRVIR